MAVGQHKQDLNFLTSLLGASEKLKIFNADLNNLESFRAAIKGWIGVSSMLQLQLITWVRKSQRKE
ncbi:hypothetical protein TorRG33x02_290520 [Trema orientale]|uniref:Uncharacterized protein n=1 Tax=Trema orientale TaxID=63057 RepID=A0A2P5CCE6_TREOI|nr:hypothetical protein TorRG33x02_290520 [Trema orientale]